MEKIKVLGWETPPQDAMEKYIHACKLAASDEDAFKKFRQDPNYKIILEGWNGGGNAWLGEILASYGDDALLEKMDLFKRNDIYGKPTIIRYPIVGETCPFTLKYILDAFRLAENLGNPEFKKIVEVGVGFGSMCLIMDSIYQFDEYTLIDLPEVIQLTKKYLSNFPEIYSKLNFISCDDIEAMDRFEHFDLFISDAALAECNMNTQHLYVDKFLNKSKFGYINYNTIGSSTVAADNYQILLNKIRPLFNIIEKIDGCSHLYLEKIV
jgi:hypothetical protein